MKVILPCMHCIGDFIEANGPSHGQGLEPPDSFSVADYNDEGIYRFKCDRNGHESVVIHQDQKFEMLFDIGAWAICDGYYREAVMSFAACLENFYEFYLRVVACHRGFDLDEKTWAQVKRSEPRFGAFVFLYFMEHGHSPSKPHESIQRIRNDVAHNGTIPTQEEAIKYGQLILDRIQPLLKELRDEHAEGIREYSYGQVQERYTRESVGPVRCSTLAGSTNAFNDDPSPDMKSVLTKAERTRESIRQLEVAKAVGSQMGL